VQAEQVFQLGPAAPVVLEEAPGVHA
jgi:hypothetical protein